MIIETESGATYDIVNGFCRKYRNGRCVATFSIWELQQGTEMVWPWMKPEVFKEITPDQIETGKHIYVRGKDAWYVTTKILTIQNELPQGEELNENLGS